MDNINELTEILKKDYSKQQVEKILNGLLATKKTTFRVNCLKSNTQKVLNQFKNANISVKQSEVIKYAFILNSTHQNLIDQQCYKNGEIYVQNFSSMLPALVLDAQQKQDVLDMCASPGGKTSLIADLTNNLCNIMALEVNKKRYERLKHNLNKLGVKNVNVMQINALQLDDFYRFDSILLDAPCSGSGTLNLNDTNSYKDFSKKLVDNCSQLQEKLLNKALSLLKVGQTMVYSTCSIIKQENEDVVIKCINKNKNVITQSISMFENANSNEFQFICKNNNMYTILPNELYQGFFIVKLKKVA